MRAVIQRVKSAKVEVGSRVIGKIGQGLLVFLGVSREDNYEDADYLIEKIINLRVFDDEEGKLNLSLLDIGGEILLVSQFTLLADCRKGRRPSFVNAANPETAQKIYHYFIEQIKQRKIPLATGEFQSHMEITLINNGPVTIILDSKKEF